MHAREGCGLIRALVAPQGGRFALRRRGDWTEAVAIFSGAGRSGAGMVAAVLALALVLLTSAGIVATDVARRALFDPRREAMCLASNLKLAGAECASPARIDGAGRVP